MDIKRINELAKDPHLIPGIYNYCDRWCERCPFTDRCLNYLMQNEQQNGADDLKEDEKNPALLWEEVKNTLDETIRLLETLMREQGLDPDDPSRKRSPSQEEVGYRTEQHPLNKMALSYITLARAWMDAHRKELDGVGMQHDMPPRGAGKREVQLWNAGKVIHWYLFQISVKIRRALEGLQEGEELSEGPYGNDADGSAKVALLGIDNSLQAWHTMLNLFPGEENTLSDIMIILGTLRKEVEKIFPRARRFRRPGFDDPQYAHLIKKEDQT